MDQQKVICDRMDINACDGTAESVISIDNPILRGMYPDPSWIWDDKLQCAVLVNSSFELVPGLPIHVSKDLAHWTHLIDVIDENMADRLLIPYVDDSGGVYAPTLRYINGKYVIACTIARLNDARLTQADRDNEELQHTWHEAQLSQGNFVLEADRLEGPWRGPYWVRGAEGIDPDLFEDNDGNVYWTQTRPAFDPQWEGQTEVWTQRIDPSNWQLISSDSSQELEGNHTVATSKTIIWRGYGVNAVWAEGPHLYRIGDYIYLMTAEGGTSFEHSVMIMRTYAPSGLLSAIEAFVNMPSLQEDYFPSVRVGEQCLVGSHYRLFEANKKNPILTHRHLGLQESVQCVGHGDLLVHPTYGWWMVSLGVRETKGDNPGEVLSYIGRESFIAPVVWEHNPVNWKLDGSAVLVHDKRDLGWPVVSSGLGRLPVRIDISTHQVEGDATSSQAISCYCQQRYYQDCNGEDCSWIDCEQSSVTLDPQDSANLVIRNEKFVRYCRVTNDSSVVKVPYDATLIVRQNSKNLVVVQHNVECGAIQVSYIEHGNCNTRSFMYADKGIIGQFFMRFHANRLTIVGEASSACAQDSQKYVGIDEHDARFLSTEWAGGFVGCLAGVLVDDVDRHMSIDRILDRLRTHENCN